VPIPQTVQQRIKAMLGLEPGVPRLALVMGGGGARAAYQAGVLRYVAEAFPHTRISVITGVSAGAINAAQLANHTGTFRQSADHLIESWMDLAPEKVYTFQDTNKWMLLWKLLRRGSSVDRGTEEAVERKRGLLDPSPLRDFLMGKLSTVEGRLEGVDQNLRRGILEAVAIITTNYGTGQTVSWVQGREIELWERANRISVKAALTVDHVMASAALPLLFPAVQLDDGWYGDGGIRLSAPLSPAIHLGASRILAISTIYRRTRVEADQPSVVGYPPTAQIIGILMNAIFLDALEDDSHIMERINRLVADLPPRKRRGLCPIKLLTLRPTVDLAKLAGKYPVRLPEPLRTLTTGLGSGETKSPDWLSMLLFQRDFLEQVMEIGYEDTHKRRAQVAEFLSEIPVHESSGVSVAGAEAPATVKVTGDGL
jgi:NTE family protein